MCLPGWAPAALLGTVDTPPAAPEATSAEWVAVSDGNGLIYSLSSDAPSSHVMRFRRSTKTRCWTLRPVPSVVESSSLSCSVEVM